MASNAGDVTCMATIPADMEVEAHFLAKEDGVVAGIALAESVFSEVDPTLKVLRLNKRLPYFKNVWFEFLVILPVHIGIRWSGQEKMEIWFIKDCNLGKCMVNNEYHYQFRIGEFSRSYLYLELSFCLHSSQTQDGHTALSWGRGLCLILCRG